MRPSMVLIFQRAAGKREGGVHEGQDALEHWAKLQEQCDVYVNPTQMATYGMDKNELN